jgi:hypothetical protein
VARRFCRAWRTCSGRSRSSFRSSTETAYT